MESDWQQVSSCVLDSPQYSSRDLNNAVLCMVSIFLWSSIFPDSFLTIYKLFHVDYL